MTAPLSQHQVEIERNLRAWNDKPLLNHIYEGFYRRILALIDPAIPGRIVEIGSGIGNVKAYLPGAVTTDLFPNLWLDLVCDGYELPFRPASLSHLVLFDVFHHLRAPNAFLREARRVLSPAGRLILFEPYISWSSYPVYGMFHHEPVAWSEPITRVELLPRPHDYYAAQGNATRLFFRKQIPGWPDGWKIFHTEAFSCFYYLCSGGYSKPALYPARWLRALERFEIKLSRWPRAFGGRCLVGLRPAQVGNFPLELGAGWDSLPSSQMHPQHDHNLTAHKTSIFRDSYLTALAVALVALSVLFVHSGNAADGSLVTVQPGDTGQALVNPDMGWTMHFYSNIPENYGSKLEPSDTLEDFPGLSTVYLRVPWAFLEPEEGRFNWALLDTPAQRWIARGKRVAFRLTCSENWMRFATPEWVKNAGAKGTFYEFGKGPSEKGDSWDPDFADPVFLGKLESFLAAMAARYEGNPNVAFVDVGTYGLWGEGHTFMSSQVPAERTLAIVKQHIDLHRKHFPRTLLCISDDVAGHDKPGRHFPETDYALSQGLTLRDDSILVQPPPRSWYHAEMAVAFWPDRPVILEHEHFGASKERGAWGDGSLLLKAVEDYHASYLSIHWWPRVELEENRLLIDRINRRLGYRLQLREITWPGAVVIGQPFKVSSIWANAGVAPCYPGGFMALTIKDAKGGMVSVLTDERLNMRDIPPGAPGAPPLRTNQCQFVVGRIAPVTQPGKCTVFVSIGLRDGTPRIALPLADDDGHHRYRIGSITLETKR